MLNKAMFLKLFTVHLAKVTFAQDKDLQNP